MHCFCQMRYTSCSSKMHLHRKTIKQENVTTEATTTKNILDDLVDPFYLPLDEIVKHHVFQTNSCYLFTIHLRSRILLHLTKSGLLQIRLEPLPQSHTHFDTHGPIVDPCQNFVSALSTFLRIDQWVSKNWNFKNLKFWSGIDTSKFHTWKERSFAKC